MGRKKGGILGYLGGIAILWVLPKAIEVLQNDLKLVDRMSDLSNILPYPYNILAGIAALYGVIYAFDKFGSTFKV